VPPCSEVQSDIYYYNEKKEVGYTGVLRYEFLGGSLWDQTVRGNWTGVISGGFRSDVQTVAVVVDTLDCGLGPTVKPTSPPKKPPKTCIPAGKGKCKRVRECCKVSKETKQIKGKMSTIEKCVKRKCVHCQKMGKCTKNKDCCTRDCSRGKCMKGHPRQGKMKMKMNQPQGPGTGPKRK
jgi:hypothetical protein